METIINFAWMAAVALFVGYGIAGLEEYGKRRKKEEERKDVKVSEAGEGVRVGKNRLGFTIEGLTVEGLRDIKVMIEGASLTERRKFDRLKRDIGELLKSMGYEAA